MIDHSLKRSSIDLFHCYIDDDFVHIQQSNSQWPKIFDTYFLTPKTRLIQTSNGENTDDDLIFYVTRHLDNDFHHPLVNFVDKQKE